MPFFLRAAFVAVLSAFTLSAVGDELLDEARALIERKLPEDCSYEELREFETAISDLTEREASRKENVPAAEREEFYRAISEAVVMRDLATSRQPGTPPWMKRNRFDISLQTLVNQGAVDQLKKIMAQEEENERIPGSLKMASNALYEARANAAVETKDKERATAFADEVLETSKTNELVREQAPALFVVLGRAIPELGEEYLDRFLEQRSGDETLDEAEQNELKLTVALAKYKLNLLAALDAKDRETSEQILKLIADDAQKDPRFAERALSVRHALRREYYSYMSRFDKFVGSQSFDDLTLEFRERIGMMEKTLNEDGKGNVALCREYADELDQMIQKIDALAANDAIFPVDATGRYLELCAPAGRIAQNLAIDPESCQRDPEGVAALLKTLVSWLRLEEFQSWFFLNFLTGLIDSVSPETGDPLLDEAERLLEASARRSPGIVDPLKRLRVRRFRTALDEIVRDAPESERDEKTKAAIDAFLERAENDPPLALRLEEVAQYLEQLDYPEQATRAYRLWLDAYDKYPRLLQALPEEVRKHIETKREIYYGTVGNDGKA